MEYRIGTQHARPDEIMEGRRVAQYRAEIGEPSRGSVLGPWAISMLLAVVAGFVVGALVARV